MGRAFDPGLGSVRRLGIGREQTACTLLPWPARLDATRCNVSYLDAAALAGTAETSMGYALQSSKRSPATNRLFVDFSSFSLPYSSRESGHFEHMVAESFEVRGTNETGVVGVRDRLDGPLP